MYILNNQQTKSLEDATAQSGIPHISLMEFAGTAVSRQIIKSNDVTGKRIAVVCGCGNNGGDGFVAARKLYGAGAQVTILLAMGDPTTDDSQEMYRRACELDIPVIVRESEAAFGECIKYADIIVDAIFGIGFHGSARPAISEIFEMINNSQAVVYSVDVPSGVDSDNGQVAGVCVKADHTVTFTALKPGHVIFPAADFCGEVVTTYIGVPDDILEAQSTNIRALDFDYIKSIFEKRKKTATRATMASCFRYAEALECAALPCLPQKLPYVRARDL
ncbi:MAG: NAD(P)H-hydrate epimerase [Clostridia bacterium]|nr:NAD(P)H-hydrate epimerase [Clostridia bacterium]